RSTESIFRTSRASPPRARCPTLDWSGRSPGRAPPGHQRLRAYRSRTGGRRAKRVQRSGVARGQGAPGAPRARAAPAIAGASLTRIPVRSTPGSPLGSAAGGGMGMLDVNPAKVVVDNPVRRRKEQHPFESWAELEALAASLGPRYGPMILFAAATGLRPAEW